MLKVIHPILKWAQRKDRVFLTVDLRDIQGEKVELTEESLKFTCEAENVTYAFEINFFAPVVVAESTRSNFGLNLRFILVKKDQHADYWTRLIKETQKTQYIQVDWTKWVEEDEEAEEGAKGDDWNQDQFNNFQGGQADEDDDDEPEGDEPKGNVDDLEDDEELNKKPEEAPEAPKEPEAQN